MWKKFNAWILWFRGALLLSSLKAPSENRKDSAYIYVADITAGNAAIHARSEGGNVIKLFTGAVLTTDVADGDTVSAPTPAGEDYAFQAVTNSTPFGFATANEGDSLISLVVNMYTRLNDLEDRLQAHGLVT